MVWDYPTEPREPKNIPPMDEDELYQEYKDRRMEEQWGFSKESTTTP